MPSAISDQDVDNEFDDFLERKIKEPSSNQ